MNSTEDGVLAWEDPPPQRRRSRKHALQAFVAELRTRPGEWGVYRRDCLGNLAAQHYQHRDIEWQTVGNGDGTKTIYGRCIPEEPT